MLDLETLGKTPGCIVLSIGAVAFNPTEILTTFEVHILAESCERAGLTMDASTVMWWIGRDADARDAMLKANAVPIGVALPRFSDWMYRLGPHTRLWSKGPSFDAAILRAAYHAAGQEPPWEFRNERCVRTILDLANIDSTAPFRGLGEPRHDAIMDALVQARAVQEAMRGLGR